MEEIYERAIRLIAAAADGQDIQNDAKKLQHEYLTLGAPYKKGQMVWFFDAEYDKFVEAEVDDVIFQSMDKEFNYRLYEKTGRNCGLWRGDKIFATKDALWAHLAEVLEENK